MMRYALLFCGLLLSACSTLPHAIEDAPLYDLSYQEAQRNAINVKNAPVRWGGIIVEVENQPDVTLMQVLYYPLDRSARPETEETTPGRFVIQSTEFLDPAIYGKDREITIAGTLIGDIERTIDKKTLRLPLVKATTLHLWPRINPNDPQFRGFYPYYWGVPGPFLFYRVR